MENRTMQLMENAFYDGAYSLVFDLSSDAIKDPNVDNIAYLYRALSEIGMAEFSAINSTNVNSNVLFAFQQLCKESGIVEDIEKKLDGSLTMCIAISNTLESKFEEADEELKKQYQGSAGITFDSDDPAEKAKQDRERAFNNNINNQRHNLKKKYDDIISSLFETALNTVVQAEALLSNKHLVGLEFLDHLETVTHRVDTTVAQSVQKFVADVRKARNEEYWAKNSEVYNLLISEKKQLEKRVEDTLATQLAQNEEARKRAIDAKEKAIKERRRYSLFNFADRKPQNNIISKAKDVIKHSKEKEKELKAGICSLCDADRKRLSEINTELNAQR